MSDVAQVGYSPNAVRRYRARNNMVAALCFSVLCLASAIHSIVELNGTFGWGDGLKSIAQGGLAILFAVRAKQMWLDFKNG